MFIKMSEKRDLLQSLHIKEILLSPLDQVGAVSHPEAGHMVHRTLLNSVLSTLVFLASSSSLLLS